MLVRSIRRAWNRAGCPEQRGDRDLTETHLYNLEAVGSRFTLTIGGIEAAVFSDTALTSGGIGFALKSVGAPVNLTVDQVTVKPVIPDGA